MARLIYALIVGLVGAAIIHIAIIFLIPTVTPTDPWSRLEQVSDLYQPTPISGNSPEAVPLIPRSDPLFRVIACRFDLEDGLLRLSADRKVPFWSLSIHDRAGRTLYSLTDRAATEGRLDIAVLSELQMVDIRSAMPAELDQAIFIESPVSQGIAVLRAFTPDPSWNASVDAFLREVRCEPF